MITFQTKSRQNVCFKKASKPLSKYYGKQYKKCSVLQNLLSYKYLVKNVSAKILSPPYLGVI